MNRYVRNNSHHDSHFFHSLIFKVVLQELTYNEFAHKVKPCTSESHMKKQENVHLAQLEGCNPPILLPPPPTGIQKHFVSGNKASMLSS